MIYWNIMILSYDLKYRKALIEKGIYHIPIACKQGSVSYAHTKEDIDKTLEITERCIKLGMTTARCCSM